jgi:hypothetical protein
MDRRDRAAFDDTCKSLPLSIVQQGGLAWGLAVNEAIGASGVEPHDPVPHDLQRHPAYPRRIAAATAIIYFGQRQQSAALVRAFRAPCEPPQARRIKVVP